MRVGIVLALRPSRGGVYQYSLTMLRALHQWKSAGLDDGFVVFAHEIGHPALAAFAGPGWVVRPIGPASPKQLARGILLPIMSEERLSKTWLWLRNRLPGGVTLPDPAVVRPNLGALRWFRRCAVDLICVPGTYAYLCAALEQSSTRMILAL